MHLDQCLTQWMLAVLLLAMRGDSVISPLLAKGDSFLDLNQWELNSRCLTPRAHCWGECGLPGLRQTHKGC